MSKQHTQFKNLPLLVTHLIRSKLNNKSLASLAMASKNANTHANLQAARERKRANELRRITRAAAWAVLDANRMRAEQTVVSSALWPYQVADELGLRWESSNAYPAFGFDGQFYQTANTEFEDGYDVVLLDKSRYGDEIAWFGMRDRRVMFFPDMRVSDSDPALQIIQRTLDAINHKLDRTHPINRTHRNHAERNRTETNRSKSVRNWRAPRVPTTGPANFVSNVTQMFPTSPHVRTLRRALINNTSRTANQRLALAAKAVGQLLKRSGGWNDTNIAKTTDMLKAWRSYQNWHTKHGNSAFKISKKRKR